jgi:L-asparaginase
LGKLHRGNVVFDFNCGGMWRAWVERGRNGEDVERIMVFREEYE